MCSPDMRKKKNHKNREYNPFHPLAGLFLIFLIGILSVSCQERSQDSLPLPAWQLDSRPPEIAERVKGKNILEDILYLNSFYQRFDSLEAAKDIQVQKYRYNLRSLEMIEGTKKEKRAHLDLRGKGIVFPIDPEKGFINIQSENLNLVEMEMACDRDADIKIYLLPSEFRDKLKEGWYGNFILQKYIPKGKGWKFQSVIFDLSQRFGWQKKHVDRLIVRITPAKGDVIRARLKSIQMLSHETKLYERIPLKSYHRYGGSARKRLESVFLPAGSDISYTIHTPEAGHVLIEGYLGSVDEKEVRIELAVDGKALEGKNVSDKVMHFMSRISPKKNRIHLDIRVIGESGRIGFIGNLSIHRPFPVKNNVVFYLADALRADKGGIEEELFQREFQHGAVFPHAYANATRTADSLPSLFTGRYKFTLVEKDEEVPFLSSRELSLAEFFKTKGYTTAAFINNPWLELSNSTQGFDQIFFCWSPIKEKPLVPSMTDYHRTKYGDMKAFIDAFIRENESKPVFIYIHTMEPHVPYETPEEMRHYSKNSSPEVLQTILDEFSSSVPYPTLSDPSSAELATLKNLYKDSVLASYEFFREMDGYLQEAGVLDGNSLLIFASDHGERFYEHGSWIHGPPDIYDEVIRIPLMMRGKNMKRGIYPFNVQLLDIYPTVLDWFGEQKHDQMPGISLIDTMNGDTGKLAGRIIYADGTKNNHYAFIRDRIKVIVEDDKVEVFDLSTDPQETKTLAGDREYEAIISEAISFREQFERLFGKESQSLSAEELERLRSLGYIK
jgi:arylsulfatase A-like enzyme